MNKSFYQSKAFDAFQRYTQSFANVLEEGKKDGSIRVNVNSRVFINFFLGAFSHMALRWFIFPKEAKTDKMTEINEVVDLLSRAVATRVGTETLIENAVEILY